MEASADDSEKWRGNLICSSVSDFQKEVDCNATDSKKKKGIGI